MLISIAVCFTLNTVTTLLHYEVFLWLTGILGNLEIHGRGKVPVSFFVAFSAHLVEIAFDAIALWLMTTYFAVGELRGADEISFATLFYFSTETFTSLGFGDMMPVGPIRMLAGIEALNGLLLVGWSASYL